MSQHFQLLHPGRSAHTPFPKCAAWPRSRRRLPRRSPPRPLPSAKKPAQHPQTSPCPAPPPTQQAPPPSSLGFQFAFPFPESTAPADPPPPNASDAIRHLRQGIECGIAVASEALRTAPPPQNAQATLPIFHQTARRLASKALAQEAVAAVGPTWKGLLLLRSAFDHWDPPQRLPSPSSPPPPSPPPPHPALAAAAAVYANWIDCGLIDPSATLRLTLEKALLEIARTPWATPTTALSPQAAPPLLTKP